MNFNRYILFARLFPAALSSVPFFILSHYYFTPEYLTLIKSIASFEWSSDITTSFIAIFLLMQMNRWISKGLFENSNERPSTNYLLHLDSHFSPEYTKKIHEKIKENFGLDLSSPKEESLDVSSAKQKTAEAVSLIRAKVKKGRLLEQHNIEYGFARNLAGGSIVGLIVSIINVAVFFLLRYSFEAIAISCILGVCYILYLILSPRIIKGLGENYAQVLVQEYMSI